MKIKLAFIIIFLLLIFNVLKAENYKYIYMKNGNVYYGKILTYSEGKYIKLETLSMNILFLQWKDILGISSKKILRNKEAGGKKKKHTFLTLEQMKNNYLKTKYIISFNTHFRKNTITPCITFEKPLSKCLKNYFFISSNLLYDEKFFTNIGFLVGHKFIKIKSDSNFFLSFALGGYYSIITNCKSRFGFTFELLMGNTFLSDDVKAFNFRYGLKFISLHYEYEEIDDFYYFHEEFGPQLYFTIGWGFNI